MLNVLLNTRCSVEDKKKEDSAQIPVITTNPVINIKSNSATSGGNVTSSGTTNVTARGVCWNTSINPTVSNSKSIDGTGTGTFSSSLTGLIPNTNYYVRAYATNSISTGYGESVSFNTPTPLPGEVSIVLSWDINRYCQLSKYFPCWDVVVGLGYSQSDVDKEAYFNSKSLSEPGTYNATNLAPGDYYYRAKKTIRTNCIIGDVCPAPAAPTIKSGKFTIHSNLTTSISVAL